MVSVYRRICFSYVRSRIGKEHKGIVRKRQMMAVTKRSENMSIYEYGLVFAVVVIANMFANLWIVPMIKKWFHME